MSGSHGPIADPSIVARIAEGAFLLVDKPRGPSSHQVTAWVRDLVGVERAGHAGTLDPNVSGLLWVGVGPALKLLPLVLEFPKRYVGVVVFHGEVPADDLARALREFEAPIYQTPPVRSAVRRERRVRTIHHLSRLDAEGPALVLDVTADSGTYIRTLAVDLGDALGVGAHLTELRRVGTGPFMEAGAATLAEISDARARTDSGDGASLLALLHPMSEVWTEFPQIVLRDAAASAIAHGANLARGGISTTSRRFSRGARLALVSRSGELVATGTALVDSDAIGSVKDGWVVDSDRVFVSASRFPPSWRKPSVTPGPPGA
ncbi:MAG: RNA-guided pseudouridylation complex pseudouridine synthase subunit Cbf5 [Thermoplasmata archaeon]